MSCKEYPSISIACIKLSEERAVIIARITVCPWQSYSFGFKFSHNVPPKAKLRAHSPLKGSQLGSVAVSRKSSLACKLVENLDKKWGTYLVQTTTSWKTVQTTPKSRLNSPKNNTCRWYDDKQSCKISCPNSTFFVRYKNNKFLTNHLDNFLAWNPNPSARWIATCPHCNWNCLWMRP